MSDIAERLRNRAHSHQAGCEICEAADEIERLCGLLTDCANDLEAYVEDQYPASIKQYPGQSRRYERDIEPVRKARAALEGK